MVWSFIASACLANVSTCLYLALIRANLRPVETFNPIDRFFRNRVGTPIINFFLRASWIESRTPRIRTALFGLVQSLADTQLVTGLAMLSAAIIKLNHGTITTYHFSVVTDLAWLSSNVHLLALLAIRTEVVGSMKKGYRIPYRTLEGRERLSAAMGRSADVWVRVVSVVIQAGLLLYCTYVSGAEGWYDNYQCSAACALGRKKGGEPYAWMVVSFLFILYTYTEACLSLWPKVGRWWVDRVRHHVLDGQGLGSAGKDLEVSFWRKPMVILWYVFRSETFTVALDGFLWFVLGVYWTMDDRRSMHSAFPGEESNKEDDIDGFGQLVPILLLGIPFAQVLQNYCGKQCLSLTG